MATSRLEVLKSMVAHNPRDSFSRYGLAMEYRKAGNLEEAMREFRALIGVDPDYVPAYFHGGQTLEKLGEIEAARELYEAGVDAASRKGDHHGQSEMQAALDLLS
ncbi:MAG TPA: tetratricopeptide repeat protein [Bryobacteraceae bacterium]|nr:tetratricopeptide repeat protein [Bryobacteraceae bacterium]